MKKLALLFLVLAMLMLAVMPAYAGLTWCSSDPEVVLPNGQGSVNVLVEVPQEHLTDAVTLYLGVPKGAQILPQTGDAKVTIVTHQIGNGHHIEAAVREDFPIRLTAIKDGVQLNQFTLAKGRGLAVWKW